MAWLAGLLFAGFIIWLLIVYKSFRDFVIGAVVLIGIGIFAYNEYEERQKETARSLIKPSDLDMQNLIIRDGEITGRVKNNSAHELSSLKLLVQYHDCPLSAEIVSEKCDIIGEEDVSDYINIPSRQVRQLSAYISHSNLPTIRGKFMWTYKIIEIRAKQ